MRRKDATIEYLSRKRSVGKLYPARRMIEGVEATTGLVEWSLSEEIYAFDINGKRPRLEQLEFARKARAVGLVNGRKVWMTDNCCLLNDHDRMNLGCDMVGPSELTFRIRVEYTEYLWAGSDSASLAFPSGASGIFGYLNVPAIGLPPNPLEPYGAGNPVIDVHDGEFVFMGACGIDWSPICITMGSLCWIWPYDSGLPAILFRMGFNYCLDGTFLERMSFILPVPTGDVEDALDNQIIGLGMTDLIGTMFHRRCPAGATIIDRLRVYSYYVEEIA